MFWTASERLGRPDQNLNTVGLVPCRFESCLRHMTILRRQAALLFMLATTWNPLIRASRQAATGENDLVRLSVLT